MYYINDKEYKCSVAVTLDIFNDRWKLAIIWHLLDGEKRFKELNEIISEITQKTLTIKLKELEEKYPEYDAPDSPTKKVGGVADNSFESVAHSVRMESLQDAFSKDVLRDFSSL